MNFDLLQNAINGFETAVQTQATDNSTLDGLNQADTTAQAKLDAATAAKAATAQAVADQQSKIATDTAGIKTALQAIADAATAAAASL